jgi:Ser/Thr protein kinase RdoA (MazF antagonist)
VLQRFGITIRSITSHLTRWDKVIRLRLVGMDGKEYFLKEKAPYVSKTEYDFHPSFHRFLYEKGAPVVPIMNTTTGEPYTRVDGRLFDLYEWVPGHRLRRTSTDDMRQLARCVASFHKVALKYRGPREGDWRFPSFAIKIRPGETQRVWRRVLENIEIALTRIGKDSSMDVARIRSWLNEHATDAKLPGLPTQFLHGDIYYANCLRLNDGGVILCDFEDAHWGYRLSEIAYTLAKTCAFSSEGHGRESHVNPRFSWSTARVFLTDYGASNPLTKQETRWLSTFIGLNIIRILSTDVIFQRRLPPPDLPRQVSRAEHMLDTLAQ